MLQCVGDRAKEFRTGVRQHLGRVDRRDLNERLLGVEQQGGDKFFGEPMLDVDDLLQTDSRPRRGQRARRPTS